MTPRRTCYLPPANLFIIRGIDGAFNEGGLIYVEEPVGFCRGPSCT
jgi:hypothetical protein